MLSQDVAWVDIFESKKINPESSDSLPAVTTYRIYEGPNTVERLIGYARCRSIIISTITIRKDYPS